MSIGVTFLSYVGLGIVGTQLPDLPSDPLIRETSWAVISFLGGIFLAAVAAIGFLIRSRKIFNELVREANQGIAAKLDTLNATAIKLQETAAHTDKRITHLDLKMAEMGGNLKLIVQQNQRLASDVIEIDHRVVDLERRLAQLEGQHMERIKSGD